MRIVVMPKDATDDRDQLLYKLKTFLYDAPAYAATSMPNFRYFAKRPLEPTLEKHLVTLVALAPSDSEGEECVGYGHLDPYDGKVWFGVAVAPSHQGARLGKMLLGTAIEFAKDNRIRELHSAVDKDNIRSYNLFISSGFKLYDSSNEKFNLLKLEWTQEIKPKT
jgi:GNAT superfamily N-acetyltransferase